ncbi:MAG: hypothetical protein ACKV2O_21540 [Acidimicrobiales bacterium]
MGDIKLNPLLGTTASGWSAARHRPQAVIIPTWCDVARSTRIVGHRHLVRSSIMLLDRLGLFEQAGLCRGWVDSNNLAVPATPGTQIRLIAALSDAERTSGQSAGEFAAAWPKL